jgi:hypothetical protein
MNMSEIELKLAALQKKIAAQEEEISRLRGEPHKPVGPKWEKIDYTANMRMPFSAALEMAKAVPDDLIRQIVADNIRKSSPIPPDPPVQRGTGWTDEPKNRDRSREFELMDRIVESQVGGANDTRKLK